MSKFDYKLMKNRESVSVGSSEYYEKKESDISVFLFGEQKRLLKIHGKDIKSLIMRMVDDVPMSTFLENIDCEKLRVGSLRSYPSFLVKCVIKRMSYRGLKFECSLDINAIDATWDMLYKW